MAAVMKGDGSRQVLGELEATRQSEMARARLRVERLQELRAVIDSMRWDSGVADPATAEPRPELAAFRLHTR